MGLRISNKCSGKGRFQRTSLGLELVQASPRTSSSGTVASSNRSNVSKILRLNNQKHDMTLDWKAPSFKDAIANMLHSGRQVADTNQIDQSSGMRIFLEEFVVGLSTQ